MRGDSNFRKPTETKTQSFVYHFTIKFWVKCNLGTDINKVRALRLHCTNIVLLEY